VKGYHAFGCDDSLASVTPSYRNGLWTVKCPTCGVVNKLARDPQRSDRFVVSGAFFVVEKIPSSHGFCAPAK
jgi:hypothetical protein